LSYASKPGARVRTCEEIAMQAMQRTS